MKLVRIDREGAHLGRRDHDPCLVPTLVQFRFHAQPGGRLRVPDQCHERFKGHEGAAPPVFREVTEEPVLNLVPLARARWKVGDVNRQPEVVGQALETGLPRARPIAVASARIGRNPADSDVGLGSD